MNQNRARRPRNRNIRDNGEGKENKICVGFKNFFSCFSKPK